MAGNSQRRGAMRNEGSKKGMQVGSGGQRRKALKGKGPTPKATERTAHPAARKARAATKQAQRNQSGGARKRKDAREVLMGRNPVVEALRADIPASALYVQQFVDTDDRVREAISIAADTGLPLLEVSRPELDRMTDGGVHQGLVLTVPPYAYKEPDELLTQAFDSDSSPLLVALDGVTDPRNLGAVVRSAAAFGAHGVIVPERRSAGVTGAVWKTSAGALTRVSVARATNLTRALVALKKSGCMTVGLTAEATTTLAELDPEISRGPLVIVVGSEGQGLSRLVADTCDFTVSIPMESGQESLNASVAAGIVLYAVAGSRSSA
jgi:23S rRNA (guanosine2251-2'-O)-methyltransferase